MTTFTDTPPEDPKHGDIFIIKNSVETRAAQADLEWSPGTVTYWVTESEVACSVQDLKGYLWSPVVYPLEFSQ